jgi:hypothetical protein
MPKRTLVALSLLAALASPWPAAASGGSGTTVNPAAPETYSGTWTAACSPYLVPGNIAITILDIDPGVTVLVDPGVAIQVVGILRANGTAAAPIVFTESTTDQGWLGLRFDNSLAGSSLRHCTISKARDSALRISNVAPVVEWCSIESSGAASGGGIDVLLQGGQDLVVRHSRVVDCKTTSHGGGIRANLQAGTLTLERCLVARNVANHLQSGSDYRGGGVYAFGETGTLRIQSSTFRDNIAYSHTTGYNDPVVAYGGAVSTSLVNCEFSACAFVGNQVQPIDGHSGSERAYGCGGAVYFEGAGRTLDMSNCVISGNLSYRSASRSFPQGSVYVSTGSALIENCTIARNGTHVAGNFEGLYNNGGTVDLTNSILYLNGELNTIPETFGAQIAGPGTTNVSYSNAQGALPWPGTGNIATGPGFTGTGIECDQVAIGFPSPCVDAGNPDPAWNDVSFPPSRGSVCNDMGFQGGPLAASWIPACLPGNVNVRFGPRVDVLTVQGQTGAVTVAPGVDIEVMLAAAAAGPAPGRFVLYVWRGICPNEVALAIDGQDVGCLAQPTPLHAPNGPQPFRCLRSRGPGLDVPDAWVAGILEFTPPPAKSAPFQRPVMKVNGFAFAATFTIQGFIEDGSTGQWSATNAVILQVDLGNGCP